MIAPGALFVVSLAGLAATLLMPGLADLVVLAAPVVLAAVVVLVRAAAGGRRTAPPPLPPPRPILVDGSNVLHWGGEGPRIETLRAVLFQLSERGYQPGVVFDANAGYLIAGRYLDDAPLAQVLDLPVERVLVVPKGSPADPVLLQVARDMGARIVTNDRYRDRAECHPEVGQPGFLVRGGVRQGGIWLDLGPEALPATRAPASAG